jgi:hypothetical protein
VAGSETTPCYRVDERAQFCIYAIGGIIEASNLGISRTRGTIVATSTQKGFTIDVFVQVILAAGLSPHMVFSAILSRDAARRKDHREQDVTLSECFGPVRQGYKSIELALRTVN